jgi:site-specific DNA recombinase
VRVLCLDPGRRTQRGTDPAHLGSGLYLCGKCDAWMRMANRGGGSGSKCPTYRCRAAAHLSRAAGPVDELVTALVLARLSRPDARLLLATQGGGIDTAALADEEAALRVRQRELVDLFTEGAITKADVAAGRARISQRLTELATEMAAAAAGSPLAGFADAPDVAAVWESASISRRKTVVDALMRVTLNSPGQGARTFDPASVRVEWRRD